MRRLILALILLLVGASAATGVRLHALTECERWIAEYRDALAHSPTMQRAKAAKHRLHRAVHPKHTAAKPRPRILPARYVRPKYTKEELLHRMQFACGDVGLLDPTADMIASNEPPVFQADEEPAGDRVSPMSEQGNPTETQAGGYPLSGVPFVPTGSSTSGGRGSTGGGGGGGVPGGGGGGVPGGGGGGSTPGGGTGGSGGTGGGSNPGGGTPGGGNPGGGGETPGGGGNPGGGNPGGGGENPGGGGNPGGGNPGGGNPGGGGENPGGGGTYNPPPPPPPPPTAVAPEPGSFVLLATGIVGAAGVIRRRFPR